MFVNRHVCALMHMKNLQKKNIPQFNVNFSLSQLQFKNNMYKFDKNQLISQCKWRMAPKQFKNIYIWHSSTAR